MAANLFGTPITNSTLEGMEDYAGMVITRKDRAHVALIMKNEGLKDYNAQHYVDNLKQAHGNGVSTKCMIYNATGDTVTYLLKYDWNGHIAQSPYPIEIANGQWGAFLHVPNNNNNNNTPSSSTSAVVYRGKNNNEVSCDWCFSWKTQLDTVDNKAFSEVALADHYGGNNWKWEWLFSSLTAVDGYVRTYTAHGCKISCATGVGSSVSYVGIMTLENA